MRGGKGLLPLLLSRARGPRQCAVPDAEYSEGSGRSDPGMYPYGRAILFASAPEGGAGRFHTSGRNGQIAREHLPDDQHRAGERDGADVRPNGYRRLGGDRCRGYEAIRLYAVLPWPGPRRPLHSHRPFLFVLEVPAGRRRGAVSLVGRVRPFAAAATGP